jgi:hypothetical protein
MTFGNFENKFRHTAFLNMDPGSEIADVTSTEMLWQSDSLLEQQLQRPPTTALMYRGSSIFKYTT